MSKQINTRAAAAKICWQIIDKGQSLDAALSWYFENSSHSPQDRGFIQELVYGVCRWIGELDSIAAQLLRSPIRNKDRVVHFVLLVGLYQLKHIDTADHAAVGETVSACKQLNKMWAKNLVNGCLRTYLRETPDAIEHHDVVSHPRWIVEKLNDAWPEHSAAIMEANNQRPPMCLRVNSHQFSRKDYLAELDSAGIDAIADPYARDGIILQRAVAVTKLPQFDSGACSVQDTAAQLAADFLQLQKNFAVLDACAAPGGKTAHMLERMENQANMHALDISARRCEQLKSTLARLQLNAQISVADASRADSWPAAVGGYDRILIDAPCSGLGVIRRHPDIKHHRRLSDLETLNKIQSALLQNLWAYLKPNGLMLYMTCSVLPSENESQIVEFVASQNDAMLEKINHPSALSMQYGVQTLPGVHGMDGFYYSLLRKRPE
jgi:16S rRNA (cytosine967-C5)-methyltransferase